MKQKINWNNPIANGLEFFASFHEGIPFEYVRRSLGEPNTPASWRGLRVPPEGGPLCHYSLEADGPEVAYLFPKIDDRITGNSELTVMIYAYNLGNEILDTRIPFGYLGSGSDPFYIRYDSNSNNFRIWTDTPSASTSYESTVTRTSWNVAETGWYTWGGTWGNDTLLGRIGYGKDSTPNTTQGVLMGDNYVNSNNRPRVGYGNNGGTGAWDGYIAYAAIWARELSDAEWNSMVDHPWQLFSPTSYYVPYTPVAAAKTLTGSISFNISADKVHTNTLTARASADFLIDLLQSQTGAVPFIEASILFSIDTSQVSINTADRPANFDANIELDQVQSTLADRFVAFAASIDADLIATNTADKPASFTASLDLDQVQTATADKVADFIATIDLDQAQTNTADRPITFTASINADQTQTTLADRVADFTAAVDVDQTQLATADRLVSFTATIDLSQIEENTATRLKSILFDITTDQTQTFANILSESITFTIDLNYTTFNTILATANASLALELAEALTNVKTTSVSNIFNFNADQVGTVTADRPASATMDTVLDETVTNIKDAVATTDLDITLDETEANQVDGVAAATFDITADKQQLNQLDAVAETAFTTNLTYDVLNSLAANVNISLDLNADIAFIGEGQGEVIGIITFAANMAQIQTNTLTIDKAVSLITDLDAQFDNAAIRAELISLLLNVSQQQAAVRGVPGTLDFNLSLDQNQSNLATRVGLATLNAALDADIQTQLDYNLFVNLATTLEQNLTTDGIIDVEVSFGVQTAEQFINTKTTAEAITLALAAADSSSIHLTATGEVSLAASMDLIQAKQLIADGNITFGHLIGLASISSADLGADITFSIVQDLTVQDFVLEFTIITPLGRTFKVYLEDRTTIVDESGRTIVIKR